MVERPGRLVGAHGDDQAVDRLRAPAKRAGELRLGHARARPDVGQEPLALRQRAMEERVLAVRLELAEAGQELGLRLRAEAPDAAHAPGLRGRLEVLDGGDPERLVERGDARHAEARHLAQLQHAGRQRGPQSLELLAPARLVELADRRGQRRADAGDLGEAVLGDERLEVGRERLQRPRPALVRASLERIPALDLEEEPDLAQQRAIARRSMSPAYRARGRGRPRAPTLRSTLGPMTSTFASWPACDGPATVRAPIGILGAPTPPPTVAASPAIRPPLRRRCARRSPGTPATPITTTSTWAASRRRHVEDCGDVPGDGSDAEGNRRRITGAVRALLDRGAVPVVLGGDDSVPIPVFAAFEGRGPLTVVQVDAHLDWRDEVHGERYGYSSPMRRASEMPWIRRMIQVGLRGVGSARVAEVADARAWGVEIVTAEEVHRTGVARAVSLVPDGAPCLVTVDCDGLDPSIMPAVMAPAPGGLAYWHVVELIRGVARKGRIAGFDLVELAPARDPQGLAARTAARIVCNAIAAIAAPSSSRDRAVA